MDNRFGRVAAGLLMEMVLQQDGVCDFVELDSMCDQAVRELGALSRRLPGRFLRLGPADIRPAVVAQLNSLIRRGMLRFDVNRTGRWLIIRAREGVSPTVAAMLADARTPGSDPSDGSAG